jgi:hypothetical protein
MYPYHVAILLTRGDSSAVRNTTARKMKPMIVRMLKAETQRRKERAESVGSGVSGESELEITRIFISELDLPVAFMRFRYSAGGFVPEAMREVERNARGLGHICHQNLRA